MSISQPGLVRYKTRRLHLLGHSWKQIASPIIKSSLTEAFNKGFGGFIAKNTNDSRDLYRLQQLQNREMPRCLNPNYMARTEQERHGIRIPGQVLDQIREKEGLNGEDSRFKNKRKRQEKPVSRKEKRKEERKLKKQKRLRQPQNKNEHKPGPLTAAKQKLQEKKKSYQPQDDPMAALKALKAKKGAPKTTQKGVRVVKEDEVDDEFSGDDDDLDEDDLGEDDFGGFEEEEESDPLAALAALKAKKNKTKEEVRVVKEDDLDDELSEGDFDDEDGFHEGMDEDAGDFDEEDLDSAGDDFDENDFDEEEPLEKEDDPLAKLKALKEKKNKKRRPPPRRRRRLALKLISWTPWITTLSTMPRSLGSRTARRASFLTKTTAWTIC